MAEGVIMASNNSFEKLLNIKEPNQIKEAFQIIEKEHGLRHTSQIPVIIAYLDSIYISDKEKDFIAELLRQEERIFWTIDDTVDYSYDFTKEKVVMDYYNEIVKFVTFIRMMDKTLEYQMGSKRDVLSVLTGKKLVAQRLVESIYKNLPDLISIPHNERVIEKKLLSEHEENKIANLIIENQLNRAQNIKIYLGTVEAIVEKLIPKEVFLLTRALQLIREDLEDLESDKKRGTNNIIKVLDKKFANKQKIKTQIKKSIEIIKEQINHNMGGSLKYLNIKIEKEEKKIYELLESL